MGSLLYVRTYGSSSWVNKDGISGLVVESENEIALVDAIKRISTDANLQMKLSEGSKNVMKNISPEKMTERCLNIYRNILK